MSSNASSGVSLPPPTPLAGARCDNSSGRAHSVNRHGAVREVGAGGGGGALASATRVLRLCCVLGRERVISTVVGSVRGECCVPGGSEDFGLRRLGFLTDWRHGRSRYCYRMGRGFHRQAAFTGEFRKLNVKCKLIGSS